MSVIIEIQGTPIEFPSTGESPNWAPAVIQFAQSVEGALSLVVNASDVPPQVQFISRDGITAFRTIQNLEFDSGVVRAAYINYSLFFRENPENTGVVTSESGTMTLLYNGTTWSLIREFVGEATVNNVLTEFDVNESGQVRIKTGTLVDYSEAKISFSAKTLPQDQ
jgi:hypothetical protein